MSDEIGWWTELHPGVDVYVWRHQGPSFTLATPFGEESIDLSAADVRRLAAYLKLPGGSDPARADALEDAAEAAEACDTAKHTGAPCSSCAGAAARIRALGQTKP